MGKIPRQLWNEFFETDSIKRKAVIRELIHDSMYESFMEKVKEKYGDTFKSATFYFEDADEGEIGTFEDYLNYNNTEISMIYEVFNEGGCRKKQKLDNSYFLVSDFVESE